MSKGETTRQAILDHAVSRASQLGLEGLTIGTLAAELGLSKSGLFAHFRSKETLQMKVLEQVAQRFVDKVIKPALRAPRGEPRLRALFERVLEWPRERGLPGGCPFVAAISELDDRPGPARDLLVRQQKDWLDTIATVTRTGIAEGHFGKQLDVHQLAFEFCGIQLSYHHALRLLEDAKSEARAKAAFDTLLSRARAVFVGSQQPAVTR